MIYFAVDDEPLQRKLLCRAIEAAAPNAQLHSFSCGNDLLAELKNSTPDVAFLDIELPDIGGLELACLIKKRAPLVNIVFVTGFSQYALEALALRPSGYVMKPASKEKILLELENLRNPPQRTVPEKKIRIQCFGDFEVFVDEVPVAFARSKSKELLAYLVDRRGAKCTASQIAATLWEDGVYDRKRQILFSTIRSDMIKSLKGVGAGHIVISDRDGIAIMTKYIDCDYYMALNGDMVALNAFGGEYMTAYSWAEFTTAALAQKLTQSIKNL